jgi:hypothetical protein
MSKLEELCPNAAVRGILPDSLVTVVNVYPKFLEDLEGNPQGPRWQGVRLAGKVQPKGRHLRDLTIEAARCGQLPEVWKSAGSNKEAYDFIIKTDI